MVCVITSEFSLLVFWAIAFTTVLVVMTGLLLSSYVVPVEGSVPSVDKIAQIADYFGCSVDYILGRTNEPKINSINIIKTGNSDRLYKSVIVNSYINGISIVDYKMNIPKG